MHSRKDIAIYLTLCILVLVTIQVPFIIRFTNIKVFRIIDCSYFCISMNRDYMAFQFILILASITCNLFLRSIARGTRYELYIIMFYIVKIQIIFVLLLCTLSAEIAGTSSWKLSWIISVVLARFHLIMEIGFSVYLVSLIAKQEKEELKVLQVVEGMIPLEIIFPEGPQREKVALPMIRELEEPTVVVSEPVVGFFEDEKVVSAVISHLERVLANHRRRYPILQDRPVIKFQDYELN